MFVVVQVMLGDAQAHAPPHERPGNQQVVGALLTNAITFTGQGYVELRAREAGPMVRVEVQDTGIGIASEQLPRPFKPFELIDGQPGPLRQQAGLSLAIAHRAVTAMGGGIGVASVPGQGSTFWFTVPRAPAKRDG